MTETRPCTRLKRNKKMAARNTRRQYLRFAERVRSGLANLDFSQHQELTRLLVEDVTFHPDRAVVRTIIPPQTQGRSVSWCSPTPDCVRVLRTPANAFLMGSATPCAQSSHCQFHCVPGRIALNVIEESGCGSGGRSETATSGPSYRSGRCPAPGRRGRVCGTCTHRAGMPSRHAVPRGEC